MSSECDDKDADKSKSAGKSKSVPTTRELEFVPLGEDHREARPDTEIQATRFIRGAAGVSAPLG